MYTRVCGGAKPSKKAFHCVVCVYARVRRSKTIEEGFFNLHARYVCTLCTTASRCLRMQNSTSGLPPAMSVSSGALTRRYTCVYIGVCVCDTDESGQQQRGRVRAR